MVYSRMAVTPMMEQYLSFKKQYPNNIVLFRMGDFFETFGEDAKISSKILNITLTTRDKNSDNTPLAGFPHHALNQYLPKIINAGYCAVVVDQIEDPKYAKGIVKRAVTRVVTPSTIDADTSLKNSYLSSFYRYKKEIFVSFIDIFTGDFIYTSVNYSKNIFNSLLTSYDPVECLILKNENELVLGNIPVQPLEKGFENIKYCEEILKKFFNISNVESIGIEKGSAYVVPLAMSLEYITDTQKIKPENIKKPKRFNIKGTMILDRATINNLEIVKSSYDGDYNKSLLHVIDQTKTLMGRRELYSWIMNPLINSRDINSRLSIVEYFVNNDDKVNELRDIFTTTNDIERLVGKIGLNRVNGRDMKALQNSLENVLKISSLISDLKEEFPSIFDNGKQKEIDELIKIIDDSITQNPPLTITEGHIIKQGFNKEVDELHELTGDSKEWIKKFEEKEKERTNISSLKIGFTSVFGYYIEVTNAHKEKVPSDYIRKQTLVNSERYITEELKQKETLILNAQEKLSQLEYKLFNEIRNQCVRYINTVQEISKDIARIDILSGFAYLSKLKSYCKPEVYDLGEKGGIIKIVDGRHPVVEDISNEEFITNDTFLDMKSKRMNIITGPNMSGKSTYIRQVATIVLLAQIGCFVPASECELSIVDRIFTRVGASDNLSLGRSTFMVEMDEAANILNNATKYSLVILDEIGRGTSTYDGVSIAWAISEYITSEIKCRTLFATHYHELLKLPDKVGEGIVNLNVLVEEDTKNDKVIFLRKIVEGGTDRSYGIYVAQMAGLPSKIINRANEILEGLEQENMFANGNHIKDLDSAIKSDNGKKKKEKETIPQIPLFELTDDEITKELKSINIDELTPLEALNVINKWKKTLNH